MVGNREAGQEKFEYSEAAMDQWRASKRRAIRPTLLLLLVMVVSGIVHTQTAVAMTILLVGALIFFVMLGQNYVIGRRAERRLKAEKKNWETNHGKTS